MSRIGAYLSGVEQQLLNMVNSSSATTERHAFRLASGKLASKPADDPSVFYATSQFEQRLNVVKSTKSQVDIAATIGAESQLVIDSVRTQLNAIRSELVLDESQGLSDADRSAGQAKIDAALVLIDSLSATEINGNRLLDGSSDFRFSGTNSDKIQSLEVGALGGDRSFAFDVSAATQATLTYTGASGQINSGDATFTLTGAKGSAVVAVANNEALTAVRDKINNESHKTGITAEVSSNSLTFTTVGYGTDETISISASVGTFAASGGNGDNTASGTDAVVLVDGLALPTTSVDGNRASFSQNGTRFAVEFEAGFSGQIGEITIADPSTPKFRLSTDLHDVTHFAVGGLQTAQFRGLSGALSELYSGQSLAGLDTNTSQAIRVVDEALSRLTIIEGHVDAFADTTVASSSALLDGFEKTLNETIETVNGIDEDEETLRVAKSESLSTNALAALSIMQQQRLTLVSLIQQQAGFY